MGNKIIDLNRSIYDLCGEIKELPGVLYDLGFEDIIKPGMIHTVGRFMNLKKGATIKKISIDTIKDKLTQLGYDVID
ncbi:MAG: DUF1858 domain-containing protein [Clostridiales bacterium]|nr:DUF1858 domain-containing protein [Bacillota bacterium]NLK03383.1 DUF1858 domain-containing protein [Clostridiales bacterium]